MKKYLAELIGTFSLVLFGCGTAVISGNVQVGPKRSWFTWDFYCFWICCCCNGLCNRRYFRLPYQSCCYGRSVGCRPDDC